jgi:CubicO group peptidase (beta-lactamase class C family)
MTAAEPESVGLVPERLALVMDVLAAAVEQRQIAGAVFGIVSRGELAFLQATGYRDTARTDPMPVNAIFPLASMTKPVASVAAMMLVERGELVLTDPVESLLPAFRDMKVLTIHGPEPARRPITVLDLFRHTAGLTNNAIYPESSVGKLYAEAGVRNPNRTLGDCIDLLATLPLMHQPGTMWDYSISPDVLARLVEVLSGEPFDRFIARRITGPLGMTDTGFAAPEADWHRLAEPGIDAATGEPAPAQNGRVLPIRKGGNNGLVGTAYDYLRFCQMMLNGGVLEGARMLGAGTVAHMGRDHLGCIPADTPIAARILGPGCGFGLGFAVRRDAPEPPWAGTPGELWWGGGFGTQFVIDPARRMAAVLMLNQGNRFDWVFNRFRALVNQTLA